MKLNSKQKLHLFLITVNIINIIKAINVSENDLSFFIVLIASNLILFSFIRFLQEVNNGKKQE